MSSCEVLGETWDSLSGNLKLNFKLFSLVVIVEFGLVKVGVIWLSLIQFCQSTDRQTNKIIFLF